MLLVSSLLFIQMSVQWNINTTYNLMHTLISKWCGTDSWQKYGIKTKKLYYCSPTWYGNLILIMQGALLLEICHFIHIILEQKGLNAIATACKCRSKASYSDPFSCLHTEQQSQLCAVTWVLIVLQMFYLPSAMFLGKHSYSCGMWIITHCIYWLPTLQEGFVLCHFAIFVCSKTSVENKREHLVILVLSPQWL